MNDLLQPLLLSGVASSYLASLLNQPKFPAWARMVVVFVVCVGAAYVQHLQHPADGIDLSARVALVFGSALLLYNNAIKSLGGEWLTNNVTPDAIRGLFRDLISSESSSASNPLGTPYDRLTALKALKDSLPEETYEAKLQEILREV
jgi:hypothetical protein